MKKEKAPKNCRPLIIMGKTGTLGAAFSRVCDERNIHHLLLSRRDLDITDAASMQQIINELNPWGIVNAAGYVDVDKAENEQEKCGEVNANGPAVLSALCKQHDIRFLSFSTDLVFDGRKGSAYTETDEVNPLSVYGQSKALSEQTILANNDKAIVIRTSSFFGPWDAYNFVTTTLASLIEGRTVKAAKDVFVSPTYVPDLVHACLDLLLDGDHGIFHVTNEGTVSWAQLAEKVAVLGGFDKSLVKAVPQQAMRWKAKRPGFSALKSEKGMILPTLDDALERCFEALGNIYQTGKIAV